MPKEYDLTRKTTASTSDLVRMVVDGQSVDISVSNFATLLSSSLSSLITGLTLTTATSTGAMSANYNVELASGTITRTLPNPNLVYDASTGKSKLIVIVNIGSSGTVTLNPYDAESIYDGGAQSSLSLSAGTKVGLISDGSNYYVIWK